MIIRECFVVSVRIRFEGAQARKGNHAQFNLMVAGYLFFNGHNAKS